MVVVLIVAAGAAWESRALEHLGGHRGIVVLKRCVDVADLLAAATAGQAGVAVVGLDAPGLDAAATEHLRRHGVQPVVVVPDGLDADAARLRAARIGLRTLVLEGELTELPETVSAAGAGTAGPPGHDTVARLGTGPDGTGPDGAAVEGTDPDGAVVEGTAPQGRVVVVWGPAGAPGRTTLAAGLAAELARRRLRTLLVDADPYGGAVAQQLGVLDEVSGLLSAARLAAAGTLAQGFAGVQRSLDAHLSVLTGLPRPDRWSEVRPGVVEEILDAGREQGFVVVDTGFGLESDPAADLGRPARNQMTLAALEVADEVVVVGSADPVGLSRLARGLVDLREITGPVRVVVNRMRPTLGWSEKELAGMVTGFGRVSDLHFLPEDRVAVDRALVAGRTLPEVGDGPLARAVAGVVDALVPELAPAGSPAEPVPAPRARGRLRRRRAGRARPR